MSTPNHHLVSNVPALLQWGQDDEARYMGLGHPAPSSSIVADIGFNASQHTALLRFRVPVWLKECQKKVLLYILVHPAQLQSVSKLEVERIPLHVTNSFIASVQQCTCAQDVFPLHITLRNSAGFKVIGPRNVTAFAPKTKPSSQVLDALRSLSYINDFLVYLPTSPGLTSHIDAFCEDVRNRTLGPSDNHYSLTSLYGGDGGVDISSLLQAGISESPPMYDGVVNPVLASSSSAKRPRSSPRDSPPPKKKQWRDDRKTELDSWASRLLQLELQVSAMRGRLAHKEDSSDSSTENASVADHLDRLDNELDALHQQMNALQQQMQQETKQREEQFELLQKQIHQIQQQQTEKDGQRNRPVTDEQATAETTSSMTSEVEERLEGWVQDYLEQNGWNETRDYFDEMIEDGVLGIKVAHQEWLAEQVKEDMPDALRAALMRILPRMLAQTELRVGFIESGAGWQWRNANGEVQDDDDE